jgi:hypothetical protein
LAAYLTYQADTVLPAYYGITEAVFQQALGEDQSLIAGGARTHYFAVPASGHILFLSPLLGANGVTLQTWLNEMTTGSPSWTNEN